VIPDSTNSLLLLLAEETVTEAIVAFRLALSAELEPTVTLPKLKLVGETDNSPWVAPVPESAMLSGEFDASEAIASVPVAEPVAAGAKATVKVTLWLGFSVVGRVKPLSEKPVPVVLDCEMVTADPPVFVKVSDKCALLPS
jgi:hypothetical protein